MQNNLERLCWIIPTPLHAAEEAAVLRQEAELNANKMMLHTKREVEEAKCNLEALYDISDLGESYSLPSLVNVSYVDSQQDNAHPPIVDNPSVEDGGLSAMP